VRRWERDQSHSDVTVPFASAADIRVPRAILLLACEDELPIDEFLAPSLEHGNGGSGRGSHPRAHGEFAIGICATAVDRPVALLGAD